MPIEAPPRVPFRGRSRLIAALKVILPLGALALLSTVFLFARAPSGPTGLAVAEIAALAREPRIEGARLAGVAADGTAVALTADSVADRGGTFALVSPRLETEGVDGRASAEAETGEVEGDRLRLSGGVRVESSAGYAVAAPALDADLSTGTVEGEDVTGEGPPGRIAAGAFRLERGTGAGARLVFHGGVRVLYQPRLAREAP